jgi:hypothetical protein
MYAIPLVAIVVLALIAVAWSPIFAVIIALPLFIIFLGYVGMSRRADEKIETPATEPRTVESDTPKGAWGEPRP